MIVSGNISDAVNACFDKECFDTLIAAHGVCIERILSTGQATPLGQWLAQDTFEWVLIVTGRAGLRFEAEPHSRVLNAGDWVAIPPHTRHRVEWTQAEPATMWLAVHAQ